ncbi:hypothetical protein BVRB_1g016380 [Beta vulgaris subsp. vulgaris]|nr:hypothetical protein BVRB_1g016380 [Beta vulgaris subsp. vulgaris]
MLDFSAQYCLTEATVAPPTLQGGNSGLLFLLSKCELNIALVAIFATTTFAQQNAPSSEPKFPFLKPDFPWFATPQPEPLIPRIHDDMKSCLHTLRNQIQTLDTCIKELSSTTNQHSAACCAYLDTIINHCQYAPFHIHLLKMQTEYCSSG